MTDQQNFPRIVDGEQQALGYVLRVLDTELRLQLRPEEYERALAVRLALDGLRVSVATDSGVLSLRQRRAAMEEAIRKAVADFEAATGFCVTSVTLGRQYEIDGPNFGTVSVSTGVTV